MKLAIMQPYVFPYIGYFILVNAVDTFVFYDDVNYIKGGWINRNKILINRKSHFFTIPCIKASPNKLIKEIEIANNFREFRNLTKTIEQAYSKAPFFNQTFPLIKDILNSETTNLSVLARRSITKISNYLNLDTRYKVSSVDFPETKGTDRANRLVEICKKLNAEHYINPIGGVELYDKDYFASRGIRLNFIQPSSSIRYSQGNEEFIPGLSIIDVIMYNSVEETRQMLREYHLF